ncbi:hypothetical protein AXX16_1376 [Serratia rubidaea]|nr:hypothetical protein AXX16_1376 [Serratia rubidaea]
MSNHSGPIRLWFAIGKGAPFLSVTIEVYHFYPSSQFLP